MKRKIFSTLLAAIMVISSMAVAFAAKKTESSDEAGGGNIVPWGAFDTQQMVDRKRTQGGYTATYFDDGKTNGCAKIDITGDWSGFCVDAPFPVGETYDISFDVRADVAAQLTVIFHYSDGGWSFPHYNNFTTEWTHVSFTYDHKGVNNTGVQTNGSGYINIRYGDGQTKASYYIDNLSIVPHGIVEGNYEALSSMSGIVPATKDDSGIPAPVDVAPVAFSDVENHWAKETVNTLATYGFIDGMGGNTYSPNTNVTRAQFVKMVVDTYKVTLPKYDGKYTDIKGDEWYASYVTLADKLGLIDTAFTVGGTFKPDQAITREEAASVAAKAAAAKNAEMKSADRSFTDEASISAWAKAGVADAAAYGLIRGYEDGSYKPAANITRAEAAQILMRIAEFTTLFHLYVDSEIGNDKNEGTKDAPLKTVYAASEKIRTVNKTMQNDINVYIRGHHYLNKTWNLTEEDSGYNGYRINYTSWGDEKPVLSMGEEYRNFQLHDEKLNIYKTYVGKGVITRQAYFNNVRGIRARSVAGLTNGQYVDGAYYLCDDTELLDYAVPTDLEFVFHINWCNPRAIMQSIEKTADGRVKLTPVQSQWAYVSNRVNTRLNSGVEVPSYIENAYELLDQEGEWYLNKNDGYLYYIPREGEDMSTMVATIPMGEQILNVTSNSTKNPVRNLTFNNLTFADVGWLRPTQVGGHADAQNNHIRENGDKMPGAGMMMKNIRYIDFTNNDVVRMGCTGLETKGAVQYVNIIGNEFFDLSGTAVTMGGIEDPVRPDSEDKYNQYNKISNNYIHHVAREYMSAAAISSGWPRHSEITHNEIVNVPYSGMHIAYGWASYAEQGTAMFDFKLNDNYIHEINNDRLYDGGGIYTLGASSLECKEGGRNEIAGNYFEGIRNAYGSVYPDEGSTYWHVYNNVSDYRDNIGWSRNFVEEYMTSEDYYWFMIHTGSIKYNLLENNYSTHPKVRVNSEENEIHETFAYPDAEWPEEAQAIIANAGIQPEYKKNFDYGVPQSYISLDREYEIAPGESQEIIAKICSPYLTDHPLEDFDIKYYSSDPSVLTVDENGVMTAVGTGVVWVEAVAFVDGVLQTKQYKIFAGDKFETIGINVNALNMIQGYTADLAVEGSTTFGRSVNIPTENITYTTTDENVVTVSDNGQVTAVGRGEAVVTVEASLDGITMKKEIPVRIITYTQDDSLELPYKNAPDAMFKASSWSGSPKAVGGKLAVGGSPAFLTGANVDNQLIAFDMSIENPNSWPSLVLGAQDRMGTYKNDDCYMIGFKTDHIELQRFNKGVRTMVFGNDVEYSPIGGPGVANERADGSKIYEYGETYSVIVGILDTDEGTRIVLTINGENMFDFMDTDSNALPANGLFGIYNTGTFTFSPYTGRTNE